jgi:hypothetical protein
MLMSTGTQPAQHLGGARAKPAYRTHIRLVR